jgi:hypothetical protein
MAFIGFCSYRLASLLILVIQGFALVLAQGTAVATELECGASVEGEFTQSGEKQAYTVAMNPGDKLNVSVTPVGDYLEVRFVVYDPLNSVVLQGDNARSGETRVLSARGDYTIQVFPGRSAGVYTLFVGCTLRDGTVIEPGSLQEEQ